MRVRAVQTKFRPAVTWTERVVAAAYADVLGLPTDHIGLNDDFFALGGNALSAARVVRLLGEALTADIAVPAMFADPTVAGLAERIAGSTVGAPEPSVAMRTALEVVLPIRARTDEVDLPPLFCLAPASGLAWCYAGLGAHIDPHRPIYGLQSLDLAGEPGDSGPATIRRSAQHYLREIRKIAPRGPYHLLGWSFGGFVAHEIAATLCLAGEPVQLVLLDTDLGIRRLEPPDPLTPGQFLHQFGPVFGVHVDSTAPSSDAAVAELRAGLAGTLEVTSTDLERLTASYNASVQMVSDYRAPRYDGDLILFCAAQESDGVAKADPRAAARRWRRYVTGTVTTYPLAATHDQMTAPEVLPEIGRVLEQHAGAQRVRP
ncbi:thioesterase domain-containing protein [Nocardia sp. CA-129566]|uniref:thioesterase domain-containing protein n=1 Tax=Nocardia sp. CA-129566 TaxID=3239976 RepID=UPI003D95BC7E